MAVQQNAKNPNTKHIECLVLLNSEAKRLRRKKQHGTKAERLGLAKTNCAIKELNKEGRR